MYEYSPRSPSVHHHHHLILHGCNSANMFWLIVLGVLTYIAYRYLYAEPSPSDGDGSGGSGGTRELRRNVTPTILPTVPHHDVPDTQTRSPRDQIAMTVESLNWCNDIMAICWPYIGEITEGLLGPTVEPLINLSLPKPFHDFRFVSKDLGRDPLKVDRYVVTQPRCFYRSKLTYV